MVVTLLDLHPISSRLFQPVTEVWQKTQFRHFLLVRNKKQMLGCAAQSSDQGKIHKSLGRLGSFVYHCS